MKEEKLVHQKWLERLLELGKLADKDVERLPQKERLKLQFVYQLLGYVTSAENFLK